MNWCAVLETTDEDILQVIEGFPNDRREDGYFHEYYRILDDASDSMQRASQRMREILGRLGGEEIHAEIQARKER